MLNTTDRNRGRMYSELLGRENIIHIDSFYIVY